MEPKSVPAFLQKRRNENLGAEVIRVETKTLTPLWRSKEDIYKFFTE
jgi:hypothetical protein